MKWNKVMNFGDPSTFGTEMADRFVASGANLPPPVSNRVNPHYLKRLPHFYDRATPQVRYELMASGSEVRHSTS